MESIHLHLTHQVWNKVQAAYSTDVCPISEEDAVLNKVAKHTANFGARTCVVVAAAIVAIVTPIFVALDLVWQLAEKIMKLVRTDRASYALLNFYDESKPNTKGVFLSDMLKWKDEQFEKDTDHLQWLFPTHEIDSFNTSIPLIDQQAVTIFRRQYSMKRNFQKSFERILNFYGLERQKATTKKGVFGLPTKNMKDEIKPAANFDERQLLWLTPNNPHFSRITHIIASVGLLGEKNEAQLFIDALKKISENEGRGIIEASHLFKWNTTLSSAAKSRRGFNHIELL